MLFRTKGDPNELLSDIANRRKLWDVMSDFYSTAELTPGRLEHTARVCAASPYTLRKIELIMFTEMWPAFIWYLNMYNDNWGYGLEVVEKEVLTHFKPRFYISWRLNLYKRYFCGAWGEVERQIRRLRKEQAASAHLPKKVS